MNLERYRDKLKCSVQQVDDVFPGCMAEAKAVFSESGLDAYLDAASIICNLGRGQELVLIFLEEMPATAKIVGEAIIAEVVESVKMLSRTANAKAINPFLSLLPTCARRLEEPELMSEYLHLVRRMANEAADGLVPLLDQLEVLLSQLSLGGFKNWMEAGIDGYHNQPWKFADYFSLQSPDSRAVMQRERHGTLYIDHERRIAQYLEAFWDLDYDCHPYSLAFGTLRRPVPYFDSRGFHIPDVYDDADGIRGIDRYRATLAHMAAHQRWSEPFIADNFNRYQQLAIEAFEDARVEGLAMVRYPGLKRIWKALHPTPKQDACPEGWSCVRHIMAMLSRALLDPEDHPYTDPTLLAFVDKFQERMKADPHDTTIAPELGVQFVVKVHTTDFRSPDVWFEDTEVGYRDDNRYMWIFLEDTDDEDEFHSDHSAANPRSEMDGDEEQLFVRHQREWSYKEQRYQPDWVTVYEAIQPAGEASHVDRLLERHKQLSKKLKQIVELLKPQHHVRVRYQEDGDQLDLDVAIRSMVDYRSGANPDPRIHMSHQHNGRDIAVSLLVDLSQSINEVPEGAEHTVLQLSQEAVSLLAEAIDTLGDPFAISGFASNTRHEVRYLHFKGFNERWGEKPKARLAGMEGGLSTRMGAAIRTAGHYLSKRDNDKRLLLVLTDGEPHDVDSADDPHYLIQDTKRAVEELRTEGVATYCISLDPKADDYVCDIFGPNGYAVIDHIERLPERLPQLFMALTK